MIILDLNSDGAWSWTGRLGPAKFGPGPRPPRLATRMARVRQSSRAAGLGLGWTGLQVMENAQNSTCPNLNEWFATPAMERHGRHGTSRGTGHSHIVWSIPGPASGGAEDAASKDLGAGLRAAAVAAVGARAAGAARRTPGQEPYRADSASTQ